jgi:hypothetical protein
MRFKVIFLFLATPCLWSFTASARELAWQDLQPLCRQHWNALPKPTWNREKERKGALKFMDTGRLIATQPRFAFHKFKNSLNTHLERHNTEYHPDENAYTFGQHDGKSLYPITSSIQVIAYRGGLYVIDGHHRALLSVFVGSPTVPVKIEDDWSDLTLEQFSQRMQSSNFVFVHDDKGQARFYDLCDMQDDPNLYLARLLTRNASFDEKENRLLKANGADAFLVVKINRGRPRQEFELADVADRLGVRYRSSWGKDVPRRILKTLAEGLRDLHWAEHDPDVIVLNEIGRHDDDDLEKLIRRHRKAACANALSPSK